MRPQKDLPAERLERMRSRLQARLDAGEWTSAETMLKTWVVQFGYHPWILEQLGNVQLRRAAWHEAGQSFFWAGVRGPHAERALDLFLGTSRHGKSRLPQHARPSWSVGNFERYPEVVQRDLAAMGVKRASFEPKPRKKQEDSLLGSIGMGALVLYFVGSALYTAFALLHWLFGA